MTTCKYRWQDFSISARRVSFEVFFTFLIVMLLGIASAVGNRVGTGPSHAAATRIPRIAAEDSTLAELVKPRVMPKHPEAWLDRDDIVKPSGKERML